MDISLICFESNIGLFVFNIANTPSVLLTTNSKERNNMFCPGEPIIVKCSVRDTILRWRIGETSFAIFGKVAVTFTAYPNDEQRYIYMNTTIGRLNFYRNESYVGSIFPHSTVISELHMHLKDANDFIEVNCEQITYFKFKTVRITVFPGMLIMAYEKLICYCKFVLSYFFIFHSQK